MIAFKEIAETITLHGLGFIQIKLPGNQRLHVWHPELPKRKCFENSSIHDHRFGFISKVLVGVQENQFFRVRPNAPKRHLTHVAYLHEGERTKFGSRPWVPQFECELEAVGERQVILPGQQYEVSPYILHRTFISDEPVVTLMSKTSEHKNGAHSFCQIGIKPDVDFDRYQIPEMLLWEYVIDAFRLQNKEQVA